MTATSKSVLPAPERRGARNSTKRAAILRSAEALMIEQGYDAVTYRSVAVQADVTAGLVHYYFPSLDELFIALLRERTAQVLEWLTDASNADQPLRTVFEYANDRSGTTLLMEFMTLAIHRESIRTVMGEGGESVRRALLGTVSARWAEYGLSDYPLSPPAALFLLTCIPRMVHLEESFGTLTGHAESIALVERFLDHVEPRQRRRSTTFRRTRTTAR